MAVDKNAHLQKVLETHRMSHIHNLVDKHKKRRDEIIEALEEKYSGKTYNTFNSGSFGKHTAINIKFDLDIVDPFKRDAFSTIQDMYNEVFEFLNEKFGDKATVRKQKVSIGVIFKEDEDGDIIDIDVVPGRELTQGDYKVSKNLNIYFNDDHWGFQKGTYTQTNIQAQIDHIKNRNDERKIIRLLKIWKHTNGEQYKSFLLELITIKAFNKTNITGNLWDKLKAVMEYIRDNVNKDGFTLIDPGNSINDVIKSMNSWERDGLSIKMKNMINRIEENDENIKSYFPINEDFVEEDSEDENVYGIKGDNKPSLPPTNQRYG